MYSIPGLWRFIDRKSRSSVRRHSGAKVPCHENQSAPPTSEDYLLSGRVPAKKGDNTPFTTVDILEPIYKNIRYIQYEYVLTAYGLNVHTFTTILRARFGSFSSYAVTVQRLSNGFDVSTNRKSVDTRIRSSGDSFLAPAWIA